MLGNEQEENEAVKLHVMNLMLKYKDIFPIARIIKDYSEKNMPSDSGLSEISNYISYNLMTRIGLGEIVKDRLQSLDKIWWETEQESLDQLKASCVKSILACYLQKNPSASESSTFRGISQDELRWC